MSTLRRRIAPALFAVVAVLGMAFTFPGTAQAIVEPTTNGFVTQIQNNWSYPIGVVDEHYRLWYPVAAGSRTRWTEPTQFEVGAGYECLVHDSLVEPDSGKYIKAPQNRAGGYIVGDWGLTVETCWKY